MANEKPAADATVNGNFKSDEYTAKLTVAASCNNQKPTGNFNMTTSGKEVWSISSGTPIELNTEANNMADHVYAVFANTTVHNQTTGKKFTNCTAFFDSVEWPLGRGIKGVNVTLAIYHETRTNPVFEWDGIFTGSMKVLKEVSCGLD